MKRFRYMLHASKGGGKGRVQVWVCAWCKCLSMYIHTIYMLCTCELSVSAFIVDVHHYISHLNTVTLVDMSVPSQACVYIHVHVRTLRGNVCTLLHVALHLEKQ